MKCGYGYEPRLTIAFAIICLAMSSVPARSQTPPKTPPKSTLDEYRHGGDGGAFPGPVDGISTDGPDWKGVFHDQTNGTSRDVRISVDDTTKVMTIRESGAHGPIQIWTGKYREKDDVYRAKGTLTEENGTKVKDKYDFLATLVLPDD